MLIVKDGPSTALRIDKRKTAHTFGRIRRDTYIQHQRRTSLLIPIRKMSCRSSSFWNKAKRFLNMSVAICNVSKIGIIQQNTFFVSCFISQSYSFLWFSPRKQASVCQEKTRGMQKHSMKTRHEFL